MQPSASNKISRCTVRCVNSKIIGNLEVNNLFAMYNNKIQINTLKKYYIWKFRRFIVIV